VLFNVLNGGNASRFTITALSGYGFILFEEEFTLRPKNVLDLAFEPFTQIEIE
jgi:hypothetical protein